MTFLSEDPTYLAGGLLLLAGAFVIALKVTQQGKYLLGAGVALAMALAVVLIEWMWVTDSERIEKVVQDVRTAVLNSDAEGVLTHLTPDVSYSDSDRSRKSEATRALIRTYVSNIHLEFVRLSDLKTSVGQQTRRGTAEFRVFTRGGYRTTSNIAEGRTAVSAWSLGFQETEPGVWKIYRISPISMPDGIRALLGGLMPSDRSQFGLGDGISLLLAGASPP
jgi:ketosteroid isomerase-like protein